MAICMVLKCDQRPGPIGFQLYVAGILVTDVVLCQEHRRAYDAGEEWVWDGGDNVLHMGSDNLRALDQYVPEPRFQASTPYFSSHPPNERLAVLKLFVRRRGEAESSELDLVIGPQVADMLRNWLDVRFPASKPASGDGDHD